MSAHSAKAPVMNLPNFRLDHPHLSWGLHPFPVPRHIDLEGGVHRERWLHEDERICCRQIVLLQTSTYWIYEMGLPIKKIEK